MFDVGFSEMMVIAVVALVVIGPEKLPRVARTVGHLMGRAQRYVNDVKTEINREMEIEELRKLQAEMQDAARKVESDVQTTLRDAESTVNEQVQKIEQDVADMEHAFEAGAAPVTASAPPQPPVAPAIAADPESPSKA